MLEHTGQDRHVKTFLKRRQLMYRHGPDVDSIEPPRRRRAARRRVQTEQMMEAAPLQLSQQPASGATDIHNAVFRSQLGRQHVGDEGETRLVGRAKLAAALALFVLGHPGVVGVEDFAGGNFVRVSRPACIANHQIKTGEQAALGKRGKHLVK